MFTRMWMTFWVTSPHALLTRIGRCFKAPRKSLFYYNFDGPSVFSSFISWLGSLFSVFFVYHFLSQCFLIFNWHFQNTFHKFIFFTKNSIFCRWTQPSQPPVHSVGPAVSMWSCVTVLSKKPVVVLPPTPPSWAPLPHSSCRPSARSERATVGMARLATRLAHHTYCLLRGSILWSPCWFLGPPPKAPQLVASPLYSNTPSPSHPTAVREACGPMHSPQERVQGLCEALRPFLAEASFHS